MKLRNYITLLLVIGGLGCQNSQSIDSLNQIIKDENILINVDASWFEPIANYKKFQLEYIPLETKNNSLVGYIDDIQFDKQHIFVLDKNIAKGLFIFDEKGKFINAIKATWRIRSILTPLNRRHL